MSSILPPSIVAGGFIARLGLALLLASAASRAQTPVDEESPWPRTRTTNGHTVTLHLPQVESWTSNSFTARAAVEVKPAGEKKESFGVVWLSAQGQVDRATRMVALERLEISRARFPDAPGNGSNLLAVLREVVPAGARTVSLDYLVTALGFAKAAARQGPQGLRHVPPEIIWVTNRTVLVLIDGAPALRAVPDTNLERVMNTPALLVRDRAGSKYYLNGDGLWFAANSLEGPWALAQLPPAEVTALAPVRSVAGHGPEGDPLPRIIVRTHPAELLMTSGLPDFRSVRGTALQYAADTDSQLFFYTSKREVYLLLSGRWFKATSLAGPWIYVAPHDLPADFARIPPGTAQGVVLASVPNTPQAELAMLANSVPTTATVSRRETTLEVRYDGAPKFKPIEGTGMSYAVNAPLPVIQVDTNYCALDNGVWFVAGTPQGPWEVATEVPEEIYTIPPSSPVYYATFASVYQTTDDEVEVGYTPGYQGAYEEEGTVVYGTGWDYEPWYGDEYYGWGWTWGYYYTYVPWYQWWVWRDWWDRPGSLRSALIENVYDRWQGRPGLIHYDGQNQSAARSAAAFNGYPALCGRFRGATRPAALTPPANTIALNPYARPSKAARAGEMPRGAQLLTSVRQSPSGGRDLYASPDGGIYRRQTDGWYRRQAGGGWNFVAPAQGSLERRQGGASSAGMAAGGGNVYRPSASGLNGNPGRGQGFGAQLPNTGFEARAHDVAALERDYYARSLAQYRAQNWRSSNVGSRVRRGGGRRR